MPLSLLNINFVRIIRILKMNRNIEMIQQAQIWDSNQFQIDQPLNQNELQVSTLLSLFQDQSQHSKTENINTTQAILNPALKTEGNSQQQKKNSLKRSVFHNFQKHLVITLRKNIQIQKRGKKNESLAIAERIWAIFLEKSTVYTKNILHILFGVVDCQGSELNNIYDEQIIQKFGYSELFTAYSEQNILQAQAYLREEVVRQLRKDRLDSILEKRRVTNLKEFKQYVTEFIEELQQGPIRKRLPKSKKQTMKLNQVKMQE